MRRREGAYTERIAAVQRALVQYRLAMARFGEAGDVLSQRLGALRDCTSDTSAVPAVCHALRELAETPLAEFQTSLVKRPIEQPEFLRSRVDDAAARVAGVVLGCQAFFHDRAAEQCTTRLVEETGTVATFAATALTLCAINEEHATAVPEIERPVSAPAPLVSPRASRPLACSMPSKATPQHLVIAVYAYNAQRPGDLSFVRTTPLVRAPDRVAQDAGDTICVTAKKPDGWWVGHLAGTTVRSLML